MIQIILRCPLSGTRDGIDWPAPGTPFEVPDAEAVDLLSLGVAEAVEVKPKRTTRKAKTED